MSIPILLYHSLHVIENTYKENEHMAFRQDLRTISRLGFRVVPLERVVAWRNGEEPDAEMARTVAITFDDGTWFDYYDIDHPTCGFQRSMFNIMRDFESEYGRDAQPELHASAFVFSSPSARDEMDRKGMVGKQWWGEEWWREAQNSGRMDVECHSWDHVHPQLDEVASGETTRGDFTKVSDFPQADVQIRQAAEYIRRVAGPGSSKYFAYPFGQYSNYLVNEYFSIFAHEHGLLAAFTTEPRPVTRDDDRWTMPRYVMARDWTAPEELEVLLLRT